GISVSRVGGNAQVKAMKKIAGTLKIDQAQYRELEAFTKFGSDLDAVTEMVIDKGRKNSRLLIQPQYSPMPVGEEIAIIYCGTKGLLKSVPLNMIKEFESTLLQLLRTKYQKDVLDELQRGKLDEEIDKKLRQAAESVSSRF
ncbi:MAG: F0F1 ATP synthase subunit alpha, partial [Bacteroidales bacterium]